MDEATRRRPLSVLLLGACALLGGCPESIHPASDPATAAAEPSLHGSWHGSFDGDEVWLHVGPGDRGMTQAVLVEHKEKGGAIKTEHYVAFPTRLGRLTVLNVRRTDEVDHDRGWSLMKYEAGRKKLTLWMTSFAAVRDDILAGKLQGKAAEGTFGETLITAPSAELVKYLQAADPKRLFDKPLVFRRAD
jgi:hypothetical protein